MITIYEKARLNRLRAVYHLNEVASTKRKHKRPPLFLGFEYLV